MLLRVNIVFVSGKVKQYTATSQPRHSEDSKIVMIARPGDGMRYTVIPLSVMLSMDVDEIKEEGSK